MFERPTNSLGHIETGPRPHPTDWCPFLVKNISALNGLWLLHMYKKLNSAYFLNQIIDDVKLRHKCLFDLILYVTSTIFQLYRDRSFWVERVLRGLMFLAQGHSAVTPVRLEPVAPQSPVMYSTTEPLSSSHKCVPISVYVYHFKQL